MNFSISELLVILLIALLVIKPEQLPAAAQLFGRCVKFVRGLGKKMKEEFNELTLVEKIERKE